MNDVFFTSLPAFANPPAHPIHGSRVNFGARDRCQVRRQPDFGLFRAQHLLQVDVVTISRPHLPLDLLPTAGSLRLF